MMSRIRNQILCCMVLVILCAPSEMADEPTINQRFPLKSGTELSPPQVWPVGECAKRLHVTGYIAHAVIKVIANSTEQIGMANPIFPEVDDRPHWCIS